MTTAKYKNNILEDSSHGKGFVVGWNLTDRCNLKCKHCYNLSTDSKFDEFTLSDSYKTIEKLVKFNCTAVNFGGGECTLHPNFYLICRQLHDSGIKLSLTTNGTIPNLYENAHLFHDIGVSLDYGNARQHDWLRGEKGVFAKAVSTIKSLMRTGCEVEIVTCLTRLNSRKNELEKLYSLCKELGVGFWRVNRYQPIGRGKSTGFDKEFELTPHVFQTAYNYLVLLGGYDSVRTTDPLVASLFRGKSSKYRCSCGTASFRIKANGDVTPCVYIPVSGGNINRDPLKKILRSEVFKSIREKRAKGKCALCSLYNTCKGGCAASSYLKLGHFDGPDSLCGLERRTSERSEHKWSDNGESRTVTQRAHWNVHERYLCTTYIEME